MYLMLLRNGVKMKIILTDCDGVILDWEYAFNCWMEEHGYKLTDALKYKVSKRYDITPEEGERCVRLFNESAAMGFLPPLRDAMHYVKLLHEKHGYVFHAITSMGRNKNAHQLRKMNLRKLFGKTAFVDFTFLDIFGNKEPALSAYTDTGCIFVEDKYKNLEPCNRLGIQPILMEHGHNLNFEDPNVTVVKNWKQIYNILTGENE